MAIYSKVSGIGASSIKGVDGISITNIRAINASLSSAFALLLDERYGFGAEAAYSVRRLSGLYNGPLLVVRRDSDDATLEVGFTSSNDLDVSAIETFCGTANGYVTEWRDQSGNLNHAAQSAQTSQPKIYDATTGIELNAGRPALNFAGDFFDLTRTITTDPLALFSMHVDTGNRYFPLYQDTSNYVFFHTTYGQLRSILSGQFGIENYSSKNEMGLRSFIQYTDGSEARAYVDGVDVTSLGGYQITTQQGSFTYLGYGGTSYSGLAQEVIVYSANKSGDRTDIEENIAGYYGDNVELLDTYSGAAAAYSLRKLSSSYNGALVRVREDGTDTQADIYANVFGELDTVTLANHCGSNNGLVVGWYDQSGNLNNATQSALTAQPKIYDGVTGVVTENGKPTVQFDGTNDVLTRTIPTNQVATMTAFSVHHITANKGYIYGCFNSSSNKANVISYEGTPAKYRFGWGASLIGVDTGNQLLFTGRQDGTSGLMNINGASQGSFTIDATRYWDGAFLIGKTVYSTSPEINISEYVMYHTAQSNENVSNIEDNINDFYGIYDTGLIGEYSGAAAAYSLRSLSSVYDGAAITVRRDSDDSTKNIYFDSNGNLDTAALTGFCGNNNGYIVRWFDQSGNQEHVTQAADSAQPKIYDSSNGVLYVNGKPSIYFADNTKQLANIGGFAGSNVNVCDIVNVHRRTAGQGNPLFWYQTSFQVANFGSSPSYALGWGNPTLGPAANTNQNLYYAKASNTVGQIFLNSRASTAGTLSGTRYFSGSFAFQGRPGFVGSYAAPTIYNQEHIQWNSNQNSTDQAAIESNINQHYLIYQPDTAPTSGLLASYPGAAAAYSLRQLSNEAVIAVTVRRDSDDNVSAIGFDGRELDTEALAAWCGNSNGYVTTWWDQSTLGNHATQASLTAQPKIYDSVTGVVTQGGKPTLKRNASGSIYMLTPSLGSTSSIASIFTVVNPRTSRSLIYQTPGYVASESNGALSMYYGSFISGTASTVQQRIQTYLIGPTDYGYINGTLNVSGDAGSSVIGGAGNIGGQSPNFRDPEEMQEIIIYLNDQSSNRTNIENDIFSFYTGYLLDQYSGAAAAYSLRALSSTATNAVQVRRDSDDATQYIGFVRDGFILSLDTSALSTFCGSANGYVSEWVDQSGNSNHATQSVLTSQPKIYDGTTGVLTDNGKPCVQFTRTGATGLIVASTSWSTAGQANYYMVWNNNGAIGDQFTWQASLTMYSGANKYRVYGGGTFLSYTNTKVADQNLFSYAHGTTSKTIYIDGTQDVTSGTPGTLSTSSFAGGIGRRNNNAEGSADMFLQELIHYPTDQSTNRTDIEDNINGYYDIY